MEAINIIIGLLLFVIILLVLTVIISLLAKGGDEKNTESVSHSLQDEASGH